MAREKHPRITDSYVTAADLSAHQYRGVRLNAQGLLIAAGAGERGYILEDDPPSGEVGLVCKAGIVPAVFGAAVATPGTALAFDANGELVAAGAGDFPVAELLDEPAGGAGEIKPVLVAPTLTPLP